ncbi:MAG: hypothetical protein JSW50_06760 [Candidatus Latescibacterota bacterium]|nr:MAG: hypothetical protein JSW50_06760 [Candidatus Latescibacterota bacterium]
MPHIFLTMVTLSIALVFAPGTTTAQSEDEVLRPASGTEARAADALRRASERFDLAADLARKSKSRDAEPAIIILEEAKSQLDRARENFDNNSFDTAIQFANSSEKLSNRALEILGRETGGADAVAAEIKRTDRLLERIRQNVPTPPPPRAQRTFDHLVQIQQDAKRHFERGEYDRALELTRKVRRQATRAAAHARPGTNSQNVKRALRLTDQLIKDAREMARSRQSREMGRRVKEAADIQSRARSQLNQNNYGNAHRLTLRAREVLKLAIGSDRPSADEAEVRDALVVTDNEIRRIRDILDDTPDRNARDTLEQAVAEQETAWREFNARRLRAALNHTRIARKLARQALGTGE